MRAYPAHPPVGQPGVPSGQWGGEIQMSRTAGRRLDAHGPNELRAARALLQEQDKSQAQMQQAQRLENPGQLAGGGAPDFNTPPAVKLTYVSSASEKLCAATESDWSQRCESARSDLS